MRALDPRLLRYARATRTFRFVSVALGLLSALLIVAQAWLLVDVVARAFIGGASLAQLHTPLALLLVVVVARALLAWAAELAASRSSARAKSQLRAALLGRVPELGSDGSREQSTGELTILATRGIDALDGYFSLYLPQLFLAVIVPVVVIAAVLFGDWISAAIIALTIPLIPLFMALVGATTRERMDRQFQTLERLAGHFLDVVAGLPTLKVFGRAHGAGGGHPRDHRALSPGGDVDAAGHVPVLADPRARRDDRRGARGGGDRPTPDGRSPRPAHGAVRARARPRGVSAAAPAGRQLSRERRGHGRRRAGVRGARDAVGAHGHAHRCSRSGGLPI